MICSIVFFLVLLFFIFVPTLDRLRKNKLLFSLLGLLFYKIEVMDIESKRLRFTDRKHKGRWAYVDLKGHYNEYSFTPFSQCCWKFILFADIRVSSYSILLEDALNLVFTRAYKKHKKQQRKERFDSLFTED